MKELHYFQGLLLYKNNNTKAGEGVMDLSRNKYMIYMDMCRRMDKREKRIRERAYVLVYKYM